MIPEWCKRAATAINRNMGTDPDVFDSSVAEDAAIIAKHAPEHILPKNLPERMETRVAQLNELVEAARASLEDGTTALQVHARIRLRRALEPFKGVS